jgi:hypothetical protein
LALLRHLAILLLVLMPVLGLVSTTVQATSMNITVSPDQLTFDYRLEFRSNLTMTMPVTSVLVDSSNSSATQALVTGPFNHAIQRIVPAASLEASSLRLAARTQVLNATRGLWRLQENITGTILGARSGPGQLVDYKLGLLSMNVSDSIRIGSVELNQIGNSYLLQPLMSISGGSVPPDVYFVNTAQYSTSFVPGLVTKKFALLDFTWLSPVSQWTPGTNSLGSSSTWTFDSATMSRIQSPFNLTLAFHPVENTFLNFIVSKYSPTVELTAPPRTQTQASDILFQLSSPSELLMPLLVAAALAVWIATYISERRVLGVKVERTRRKR